MCSNARDITGPAGNAKDIFYKRFKIDMVPDCFSSSEISRIAIVSCIDRIQACRTLQSNIDNIYSDKCDLYYEEMNKLFRSTDIHPASKKRLHRSMKPCWCDELQIQWKLLCKTESLYLKASGNERKLRRQEFTIRQNIFDSMYRKAERQYKMENLVKLEQVVTNDPKQFWSMLKRLGPRRKNDIP